jgi:hypothetical protein
MGYNPRRRYTLYVIRINNSNNFLNSKPCVHCTKLIKRFNFIKIVYSSGDGFITTNVNDLESDHLSYYHRLRYDF